MKHRNPYTATYRQPMYPGAADERYFAQRALEILTAILSGTGALPIMLFFVTMA